MLTINMFSPLKRRKYMAGIEKLNNNNLASKLVSRKPVKKTKKLVDSPSVKLKPETENERVSPKSHKSKSKLQSTNASKALSKLDDKFLKQLWPQICDIFKDQGLPKTSKELTKLFKKLFAGKNLGKSERKDIIKDIAEKLDKRSSKNPMINALVADLEHRALKQETRIDVTKATKARFKVLLEQFRDERTLLRQDDLIRVMLEYFENHPDELSNPLPKYPF